MLKGSDDFRLRFWDRFLGSFLNASSSKVDQGWDPPGPTACGPNPFWSPT